MLIVPHLEIVIEQCHNEEIIYIYLQLREHRDCDVYFCSVPTPFISDFSSHICLCYLHIKMCFLSVTHFIVVYTVTPGNHFIEWYLPSGIIIVFAVFFMWGSLNYAPAISRPVLVFRLLICAHVYVHLSVHTCVRDLIRLWLRFCV